MSHILIFEPRSKGHHPMWLRYLSEDLLNAGHQLTLAIDAKNEALVSYLNTESLGLLNQVNIIDIFSYSPKFKALEALAQAFEASQADEVLVTCFDEFSSKLQRMAIFGKRPAACLRGKISAIYHRPRPLDATQTGFANTWKRWGMRKLACEGWFKTIMVLDEFLEPDKVAPGPHYAQLVDPWDGCFKPENQREARIALNIDLERPTILHYGVGDKRKGLQLLLEALQLLPQNQSPFLIVAGRLQNDPALIAQIEALATRGDALLINRYISSEEEINLFAATDLVDLPYLSHYGSSSVLIRAAAARRPVIASDYHLLGQRTRHYGLGYTFANENVVSLAHTLKKALTDGKAYWQSLQPAMAACAESFTRTIFRKQLMNVFQAQ